MPGLWARAYVRLGGKLRDLLDKAFPEPVEGMAPRDQGKDLEAFRLHLRHEGLRDNPGPGVGAGHPPHPRCLEPLLEHVAPLVTTDQNLHPHSGLRQISFATRGMAPWWMHAGVQCPGDHSFKNTWPRLTEPGPDKLMF